MNLVMMFWRTNQNINANQKDRRICKQATRCSHFEKLENALTTKKSTRYMDNNH
jgi:hypothetical protein